MRIRDLPHPDPGIPDVRTGGTFLRWLYRQQLGGQTKALLWGLVHTGSVAAFPLPVGLAVQAVVDRSGSKLMLAGGLMALLGVLVSLGDTMLHRSAVTNWITSVARVQQLLARKTTELGAAMTRRVAAGEIVAVSTGDLEKIGWFVEAISRCGAAALTSVGVCVALVVYQPALGIVVAIGVPFLALAVLPLLPPATRRADAQREKAGRATELASDTVAGLRVLRGIGGEELFLGRYRRASQEVRKAAVRSARMWSLISAVQVALPGLLLIAVVWYGARLALDGRIAIGELVTVYSAVVFLLYPIRHIEEIAMAYSFSRPSAKRAARVLALSRPAGGRLHDHGPPAGDLHDPASGLTAVTGRLTAVVCGDPDAAGRLAERLGGHPADQEGDAVTATEAVDAAGPPENHKSARRARKARKRESAAVAAGSPDSVPETSVSGHAGPEVYAEPAGPSSAMPSVLLGGTPLDDLPRDAARAAVLVQDKDPVLLSGTLHELLDVPASGRVGAAEALAAAQCGDVLTSLAQASVDDSGDPMRTRITERGRSLSGGQRQRLALARSLVTDPEVLVLDEPTSAVDSHTEARIADGLRHIRAGRTTVVLSSSPLLLDRADQVVFLQNGKVAAEATHRELLRTHPGYRAVVTRETEEETPDSRLAPSNGGAEPPGVPQQADQVAESGTGNTAGRAAESGATGVTGAGTTGLTEAADMTVVLDRPPHHHDTGNPGHTDTDGDHGVHGTARTQHIEETA
ncbi:ABC transporter transmembrane domain-containing protein [Streptomyces sp. NPDC017993]|uniref:ABC transporter transmembrane domain-containing protein n=1 Tax=Streptomyces sp. NPDC017993 TaxID=3365027 RepID=UPI0037B6D3A5